MKPTALVVEDDPDLLEIFSRALQAAGYSVEMLRDGADARSRLKESSPDTIVLDMHLPHVSGVELLGQIYADERLKKHPVVVATADARLGEALADTVDFVLIKPISYSQLREITARLKPKGVG
jgi:two-component system cell cycle response regulator DivK